MDNSWSVASCNRVRSKREKETCELKLNEVYHVTKRGSVDWLSGYCERKGIIVHVGGGENRIGLGE